MKPLKSRVFEVFDEPVTFSLFFKSDCIRIRRLKDDEAFKRAGDNWVTINRPGLFAFVGNSWLDVKVACLTDQVRPRSQVVLLP